MFTPKKLNKLSSYNLSSIFGTALRVIQCSAKFLWHSFFIIILCKLCYAANAQDLSYSKLLENDIKRTLHEDQFTELEADNHKFSVQFIPSMQALNKGLVIFIPDANSQLGDTTSLMALRQQLSQLGWSTVLIPSSDLSKELIQEEEQGAEQEDNNEAESDKAQSEPVTMVKELMAKVGFSPFEPKSYLSFDEQLVSRLNAIESHYQNVLGRRIIVSQGLSASAMLKYLSNTTPSDLPIDGLIINNPYFPEYDRNKEIPRLVAQVQVPLLDILSAADNRWSMSTQDRRRVSARVGLKQNYRQLAAYGLSKHEDELNGIAKDIYGWTTYLGW